MLEVLIEDVNEGTEESVEKVVVLTSHEAHFIQVYHGIADDVRLNRGPKDKVFHGKIEVSHGVEVETADWLRN